MSREILVIERIHPDEWPKYAVSELLEKQGVPTIKTMVGNPDGALHQQTRRPGGNQDYWQDRT